MLYEETEKKEIEKVYAVFADYIRESPYLEWLWSDKLGYLLLKISTEKRYVEEEILVDTADQLAEVLFSEVSMDVLQMTGNDHTEQTADPLELAEIKRRWNPFLERLPEYQTVCEKSLPGKSNPTRLSVRSMKVLLALFCGFFVNLIKKSLTTRFGQNTFLNPHFLRGAACPL